jgi:hypothetical protein
MGNNTIAVIQLAATVIVTFANILLTILTYRYVRLTAGMLEHMRQAQTASVVVDLTFDSSSAYLAISNTGSSAATNIRFERLEGVEWSSDNAFDELRANGVSYLPPGRTIRFWGGFVDWDRVKAERSVVTMDLVYEADGTVQRRDFIIDMMQYIGSAGHADPAERIAEAIDRLCDAQRDRSMFSRMGFSQRAKKACAECAEMIPVEARVCSHCQASQGASESLAATLHEGSEISQAGTRVDKQDLPAEEALPPVHTASPLR